MIRRILTACFLALVVASIAIGQTENLRLPTPEKTPELLHVELLLFQHTHSGDYAQSLYDMQNITTPTLPDAQAISTPDKANFSGIYAVSSDKHRLLLKEAQKMRASKRLQFLHHIAWLQPFSEDDAPPYVRLLDEQSRGVLSGMARVTPGKYNRIEVLLRYDLDAHHASAPTLYSPPAKPSTSATSWPTRSSPTQGANPPSSRVLHIDLTGLTPAKQLLYMDHPILAALATVTRTTRQLPAASPIYPTPANPSTPTASKPARSSPTQGFE